MALLDASFREATRTLVNVLGAAATLRRTTPGVYSALTGVSMGEQITDETVKITPPAQYSNKEIDWTAPQGRFDAILRTDLRVYLAAKGLTLDPPSPQTDQIVFAGVVYKVIDVKPDFSGDLAVGYELQLRK